MKSKFFSGLETLKNIKTNIIFIPDDKNHSKGYDLRVFRNGAPIIITGFKKHDK